jgi:hypothetical protein
MSPALDIEIDLLDSLLDDEIPCEAQIVAPPDYNWLPCDMPSVARVKGTCAACGYVKVGFACKFHVEEMKQGRLLCARCDSAVSYKGAL